MAGPVLLVSAATLAFEILLVRIFSIEYFNHFAFMAIGVAMLGTGVGGIVIACVPPGSVTIARRWLVWAAMSSALVLIASATAAHAVRLDPMQMLWDRAQWVRLALVYVTLAAPFAIGGFVVLSALLAVPDRPGRVYGASFLGAALGGVVVLLAGGVVRPERIQALPPLVAMVGGLLAVVGTSRSRGLDLLVGLTVVGVSGVWLRPPWRVDVSPHKALPQVEAMPAARRVTDQLHPAGWLTAVEAPAFRYAPGLSLGYRGPVPTPTALFVDGALVGAALGTGTAPELYDWLPSASAYALGRPGHVLVLDAGGGTEVGNAVAHGASRVTAVESRPGVRQLIRMLESTSDAGWPGVDWTGRDGRSVVAGDEGPFDLIALQLIGSPGGQAGGLAALDEDYLHTVDAYAAYLDRLAPGGVLAITSWLTLPPRRSLRMILTGIAALRARDLDPDGRVIVVRSWATVTLLVKPDGVTQPELTAVHAWAARRQFDLDWYPGIVEPASRFHELEDPVFFAAVRAAGSDGGAAGFVRGYPFDVGPVRDARPFPEHFLRLGGLARVLREGPGGALPVAELGLVAVIATLVQGLGVGAMLLLVPAGIFAARSGRRVPGRLIPYFGAIGVAYMAAEIAAIQQATLLLGHPVYAVTAVLVTMLIASGIGSAVSDRYATDRIRWAALMLAGAWLAYAALLLPVIHAVQSLDLAPRSLLALVLIAPPSVLMGVPFPAGLRQLAGENPVHRAWSWAANGFASVVATPLAMLIALEAGSQALLATAAGAYAAAGILLTSPRSAPAPQRAR